MIRLKMRGDWRRAALLLLVVGAALAAVFAGGVQASGAPASVPVPQGDAVVLTGSYSCSILSYTVLPPPAVPSATPEPGFAPDPQDSILVRELSHAISLSGTGGITAGAPGSPGPGIGGISGGRSFPTTPVNLGSGVGAGFDGGTLEDCSRFAGALAAAAGGLGCVASPVRVRAGVPILVAQAGFSFVCEGPAAVEVHVIGELDRAVLALRPASNP